jgi:hypothetical protein
MAFLAFPIKRRLLLVALAGLVGLVSGCGPSLAPVSGKVTLANGNPVTTGIVTYKPDKAKGNNSTVEARGDINESGEYTLKTDGKPGAPPGKYKVTVYSAEAPSSDPAKMTAKQKYFVNPTFADVGTTPLEKEVVTGAGAGAYDLKVGP